MNTNSYGERPILERVVVLYANAKAFARSAQSACPFSQVVRRYSPRYRFVSSMRPLVHGACVVRGLWRMSYIWQKWVISVFIYSVPLSVTIFSGIPNLVT